MSDGLSCCRSTTRVSEWKTVRFCGVGFGGDICDTDSVDKNAMDLRLSTVHCSGFLSLCQRIQVSSMLQDPGFGLVGCLPFWPRSVFARVYRGAEQTLYLVTQTEGAHR